MALEGQESQADRDRRVQTENDRNRQTERDRQTGQESQAERDRRVGPGPSGPGWVRMGPEARAAVDAAALAMKNAAEFIGRMKTTTELPSQPEVADLVRSLNESTAVLNAAVALPSTKHLGDQ